MTTLTQNSVTELLLAALPEHKHWAQKISRGAATELFFEHPNGTEFVSLSFKKDKASKNKAADKPIISAHLSRSAVPGHWDAMPKERTFYAHWGERPGTAAPTLEDLTSVLSQVTN